MLKTLFLVVFYEMAPNRACPVSICDVAGPSAVPVPVAGTALSVGGLASVGLKPWPGLINRQSEQNRWRAKSIVSRSNGEEKSSVFVKMLGSDSL